MKKCESGVIKIIFKSFKENDEEHFECLNGLN